MNPLLPALGQITYPGFSLDIVSMNLVHEAVLEPDGTAKVLLRPLNAEPGKQEAIISNIKTALKALPQVKLVEVSIYSQQPKAGPAPARISGVDRVIAVASCKGGVGKSTLSINLANALAAHARVGILDLDIYGPSLPIMLNMENIAIEADSHGRLMPVKTAQGLQALSVGFMSEPGQPLSWRGPLLVKMVDQLLLKTAWQDLNVLIIDLPPGTGDVQMSLLRHIILDGIIIVSTPEPAAISDTRRGISLFRQNSAPILGLVENMSYYVCPCCGNTQYLFGKNGVEALAKEIGLPFLGNIPLNPANQELTMHYEANLAAPYEQLAGKLLKKSI